MQTILTSSGEFTFFKSEQEEADDKFVNLDKYLGFSPDEVPDLCDDCL
jgi:hypothetical protein